MHSLSAMHSLSVVGTENSLEQMLKSDIDGVEPNTVEEHVQLVLRLGKDCLFSRALQHLYQALGLEPGCDELFVPQGRLVSSFGPWEDVLSIYNEAVEDFPKDATVWVTRALIFGQLGEPLEAYRDLTKALKLPAAPSVSKAQIYLYRASFSWTLCQTDEALSDYHMVLTSHPNCAAVRARLGCLLHQLGRCEEALSALNDAVSLEPNSPSFLYSRGMLYHALDRSALALQDLNQALSGKRECTQILMLRGEVFFSLGQRDAALKDWSKILVLEPLHVQALLQRGKLFKTCEQWEDAIEDLSRLIASYPSLPRPYLFRSECFEALGKVPQAISDCLQALRCATEGMSEISVLEERLQRLGYKGPSTYPLPESPSRADLLSYLEQMPSPVFEQIQELHQEARCYMLADEADVAIRLYSAAIDLDPNLFDSYIGRAQAYKRLGRYEQAMTDLRLALELCPQSDHALYQRSLIHYDNGDFEKALTDVQAAISIFPFSIDYYNQCGMLCMLLRYWKDAILAFEEVILLDPIDTSAISQLGHLCLVVQWPERAIEWYDLLLELEPDDYDAWHKRGDAYAQQEDWERALLDWEEALSLEPINASLYFLCSEAHLKCGRYWRAFEQILAVLHFVTEGSPLQQKAQSLYQKIVASLPQTTASGANREFPNVERLLQASEEEHALALVQSLLFYFPKHALLHCLQGRAYHASYNYDKAKMAFEQALSHEPNHPETLFSIGCFLSDRGEATEAIPYLNQAICSCSSHSVLHEAYYKLGASFKQLQRYKESLVAFTKATTYKSDHAFSWLSRGQVEDLLNRPMEAIHSYSQTISLAPELSAPWFHRACAYAKAGRKEPALRDLYFAVERNSRFRREAMAATPFSDLWNDPDFIEIVSD